MTIRRILILFFLILMAELLGLSFVLSSIISGQQTLAETENRRYQSYKIADELRQSSDDLTRMARTYVVTGNPIFEHYFSEILDIRNGTKPRPRNYDRIYWDLVTATAKPHEAKGEFVSLKDRMSALNLTAQEKRHLEIAQKNSDKLVKLENQAMNTVKGVFSESSGLNTANRNPDLHLARSLMFNQDYHKAKADIMKPIDDFLVSLENRLNTRVSAQRNSLSNQFTTAVLLVAAIILTFGIFSLIIGLRVVRPIDNLIEQSNAISKGNYGNQVSYARDDEIGTLSESLNSMSRSIMKDIFRRRETEKQLRKKEQEVSDSQQLLETVLDNVPAHIFLRSLDGKFLLVNKQYEQIYNVNKSDVVGKTLRDVLPKEKAELFMERDNEIVSERKAIVNETQISFGDEERIYSAYKFPILNSDGEIISIGGIAFDITERKETEEKIRASELLYTQVLNSMSDGIYAADKDLRLTLFNNRAIELNNLSALKVKLGDRVEDIVSYLAENGDYGPGDIDELVENRMKTIRSGKEVELETQFSDGRYLQLRQSPLREGGVVVNISDVTQRRISEELIRQSEADYRSIFENAGVGVMDTIQPSREIIRANQWLCDLLDYRSDQLIGKTSFEITHPDDNDLMLEEAEQLNAGKIETYSVEKRFLSSSGDPVWCEVTVTSKPTISAGTKNNLIIVNDISQRKLAEENLRRSEAQFRAIFENAGVGVIEIITSSRQIVNANQYFCNLLGFNKENLIGKTTIDITHPDDSVIDPEKFQSFVEGDLDFHQVEKRYMTSKGEPVWCQATLTRKNLDIDDLESSIVVVNDISQRKLAEENLKKSEENFRTIFENAGVGVMEITMTSRHIINANQYFCDLLGYDKNELIGMSAHDVSHPDDLVVNPENAQLFMDGDINFHQVEKRYLNSKGEPIWCEVTITRKRLDDDDVASSIVVVNDITQRKLAEEARDILTDELAHRLKNNMNIVMSLVRFARRSAKDVASYEAAISGQLRALSAAQEWLYKSDWRGVKFDDLCNEILKPFYVDGRDRFEINVPDPLLSPQIAQIISLMIHELATNSTKYGSLSRDGGTVSLDGSIISSSDGKDGDHDELQLTWKEKGGPTVSTPKRSGFGTSILNRIIRDQLLGEFEPQWHEEGLECNIKIRL